ncbi:hypothetical protein CON65_04295 [Bacillus pseudomycoides]|uniref:Uncharacterized protein n=1 Tax=Bacillus pseudomycoides TaxID=64104 RepID=A0AA91VEG9_9BACI|nr:MULTISPECIES: hypothetical protein [Bacillus]PEB53339.1 hypothetical protein COO03_09270 [Bacillus sp. AFS098217]PED83792.1 hypothetical protein CON65_04295 [Bacillus pseudomycoides]PEU14738.1 hypothetical protein CN524_08600 [Bacillus sp. AFS019443]PEU19510.1 hypothetical protein CN525_07175 [Bacillus sp. AFS014408]PFW64409.1 hypothetical protein COL20_04540 [Bacillus sp. AFS075034]
MAVTFYVANNQDEIYQEKYGVYLEDEVHECLWKQAQGTRYDLNILIDLDPYRDKQFNVLKLKRLKRVSELLIRDYDESEVIEFAEGLYGLCVEALNTNRLAFALGD